MASFVPLGPRAAPTPAAAVILFKSWVPSSGGAYVASCLAVIALAVAVQAVKAVSLRLEARWAMQLAPPDAGDGAAASCFTSGFGVGRGRLDGKDARRSSAASTAPMLRQSMRQSSLALRDVAAPALPRRFITQGEASMGQLDVPAAVAHHLPAHGPAPWLAASPLPRKSLTPLPAPPARSWRATRRGLR